MNKALKDLQRGDRVRLTDPDGIGRVTGITRPVWISVAGGSALEVQWQRIDGVETGWYVGHPKDVVKVVP